MSQYGYTNRFDVFSTDHFVPIHHPQCKCSSCSKQVEDTEKRRLDLLKLLQEVNKGFVPKPARFGNRRGKVI